jgi:uncharacterized protein (DUF1501 family)
MLTIQGKPGRLCDGPSRRELLTIGGLGLIGLHLPTVLHQQSQAKSSGLRARADAAILLYLQGAPSHIDLWDPKPDAPDYIRGEFKAIATKAPGITLGEVLPLLAQQADKFALIRSLGAKTKALANHGSAIYMLMTGHDPSNFSPTGLAVPPSREDLPSVGANIARHRPTDAGTLSYATLCGPVMEAGVSGLGQGAGLLGGAYDPFPMYEDATRPLRTEVLAPPPDVTLGRLRGRMDLRAGLASREQIGRTDFDHYYSRALSLVESMKIERAFRLDQEPRPLREKFGMTRFGQACLLARRLIEAGTRFVQVTWPARSDDEPAEGPDGSWDTHRNNFPMLRKWRCPVFDRAAAALIADLHDRGLLERTLVLAIGEFGRSPKLGSPTTDNVGPGGRDHWPACYSCMIAGGGVRPGQVYGESDPHGAYPKSKQVHPYDVIATIYHALGINPATEYRDTLNRPRRLVEHGSPILGLL